MRSMLVLAMVVAPTLAMAEIDPRCEGLARPADYDEQVQQDFQANYYALVSSFSPMHAPVPHAPGRGSLGVDVSILPPLSCAKQYVLNWTKTEDTNKSPVLPRLTASYAFPAIKEIVVPYAAVGFLPPMPINGTRNLVVSGEFGLGFKIHPLFEAGLRGHTTMQRTYGDIATAFDPENEPAVEDAYISSTWGIDAMVGVPLSIGKQQLTPYAAVGYLDASTFFFVGDSNFAANNLHPYSGMAFSVGLDLLAANRFRLGGEFYGAPGGYSLPDPDAASVDRASRYGRLYTARIRLAIEL